MADWKKIVVSGSNPEFNTITASGEFSASGRWFANLDEATDQTYVVTYSSSGEFGYRELNSFPGFS